jgi:hypothetical protein
LRAEKFQFISLGRLFFLFFDLPPNLIVAILGLKFFLFFKHLSMNRLRLRRSGAALLFPVHYRAGDSIRFLLIAAAGIRNAGADITRTAFG